MAGFPDHENTRAVMLFAVCVVMWTLAALAVGSRFWARWLAKKIRLVWNDWAILGAMVFGTGLVGVVMTGVLIGSLGQHAEMATPAELIALSKIIIAGQVLWALSNLFTKISILHLYIELFFCRRPFRLLVYSVMGLAVCLCLVISFEALFLCRPLAFGWDRRRKGSCGDLKAAFFSQAGINICIDAAIVAMPAKVLWGLQMPLPRKLGVGFMFSVGVGIVAITALRINSIRAINFDDLGFSATDYALFNVLETTLGIFNACLPVTPPVFMKLLGRESVSSVRQTHPRAVMGQGTWRDGMHDDDVFPLGYMGSVDGEGSEMENKTSIETVEMGKAVEAGDVGGGAGEGGEMSGG